MVRSVARHFAAAMMLAMAVPACAADLEVTVTPLLAGRGHILYAIYGRDGFLREGREIARGAIPRVDGAREQTFVVVGLPAGEIVVAVFLDENDDRELNVGMFGQPLEPYGFSQNPQTTNRAPTFEEAAFVLSGEGLTQLTVRLVY